MPRKPSRFVVAPAQDTAQGFIEHAHMIHLAAEHQQQFGQALLNPPGLAPAMERAKAAHALLIAD